MFKALKDEKIIAINEANYFPCMEIGSDIDEVVEDKEHTCDDYEQYNGEFLLKSEIPAPTHEEVAQKRRQLYIAQKDPITCQIQALKDEEQTEEILAEIEALKVERAEVVAKIKEENPYPKEV